ncbi:hypothetical protein BDZ45DRAFT_594090, partial [Acephala macrosclerotiorum]
MAPPSNAVTIDGSTVDDWVVKFPETDGTIDSLTWAPQVTAPMPLEAIADLFTKALGGQASDLLSKKNPNRNMVSVTKDFFQSSPNGITSDAVTADVLGFFSLIVSYAKAAKAEEENESPKELTSIMPRTDFTNLFNFVKAKVPGDLYELVKVLACYKNTADGTDRFWGVDTDYATGTVDAPVPNAALDQKKFSVSSSSGRSDSCTVQEWIQSIAAGTSPDRLSQLDQVLDSSIGGLKDALENVLNTQRAVPLFEFRRLPSIQASGMQAFAAIVEQAVIDYHSQFP